MIYTFKSKEDRRFVGQCEATSLIEANQKMHKMAAEDNEIWIEDDVFVEIWGEEIE